VVAAVVFAEFLHAENVSQRRKDAKKNSDASPHGFRAETR
jgi:hypothetical protein